MGHRKRNLGLRRHHDALKLPLYVECENIAVWKKYVPTISAGASLDAGGRIHVSLCNIDPVREQKLKLELKGILPNRRPAGTFHPDILGTVKDADALVRVRPKKERSRTARLAPAVKYGQNGILPVR